MLCWVVVIRRLLVVLLWTSWDFGPAVIEPLPTVHAAVPPILDCVVAASMQSPCNLGPSLAHLSDHTLDEDALLWRDWVEVKRGLEVLMEALAALFRASSADHLADTDPV